MTRPAGRREQPDTGTLTFYANGGGTTHEYLYGPGGAKLAVMSGQSLEYALIPLPGGGDAEYYQTSGLIAYHHSPTTTPTGWAASASPARPAADSTTRALTVRSVNPTPKPAATRASPARSPPSPPAATTS